MEKTLNTVRKSSERGESDDITNTFTAENAPIGCPTC